MRIGIFTFFQTNYGAILQAYALQKYLQNHSNVDVEIVDFTTERHLSGQRIIKKYPGRNPFRALKYYYLTFRYYSQLNERVERTALFKRNYINFTRRYSSVDDVLSNHPIEDIYLTGSDQVFNSDPQYRSVYFLGFSKGRSKKVAYAPSFGFSNFDKNITQIVQPFVQDFDFLSCREEAGAAYLSSLVGYDIPEVVDPVLLHNSDSWNQIAIKPEFKKEYIFIYDLNGAYNLIKIAKRIQNKTKLPIVCLTGNRLNKYPVNKQIYNAGPAEFIGWIEKAAYVVTDSFHGTVFSVIFKKNFYTFVAIEETSSRIIGVLNKAGLSDRIIRKRDLTSFEIRETGSQYTKPDLEDAILKSKNYISTFLP